MVVVVMIVAIMTEIAIVVLVRVMVVLYPPVLSIPVACEVLLPVMVWRNPTSALVRWPGPIALVPFVVTSHGVPIALDPDEVRPRTRRNHSHRSGRRRRTNPNADRELRMSRRPAQPEQ